MENNEKEIEDLVKEFQNQEVEYRIGHFTILVGTIIIGFLTGWLGLAIICIPFGITIATPMEVVLTLLAQTTLGTPLVQFYNEYPVTAVIAFVLFMVLFMLATEIILNE